MYEKELRRILDASQNNALTFFVGAGVSALSGAPTWKSLINSICDKLGCEKKDSYSSDEYLQIPQMFFYSLGENKEDYYKFVKEQLPGSGLQSNKIHSEMLNLNPVSFITTNYDTLLEDTAVQHCQSFKVVSSDERVPTIFGDRFILKVHGDFEKDNFVLKEEDYLNYSENFKLIETLTKAIFSTNTVVFIGYGLNDYNIKLILNWAKSLLKNNFREPIFLYTGDQPLTNEELIYHNSKGLSVIEWQKLSSSSANDYLTRYQLFFDALNSLSQTTLDGKTEEDAFEALYNLLLPLDRLKALRIEDVTQRLSPHVTIRNDGSIIVSENRNLLLKEFFDINQMSEEQQRSLEKGKLEKYLCILSVFKKARISWVVDKLACRCFIKDVPFANRCCITFDYASMNKFSAKEYTSLEKNYIKAFYLARLRRYDEAFFLFSEVAKMAFAESNYLLYYFAKSNCISLRTIIKNVNKWLNCYDISTVEAFSPSYSEIENLFHRLPVEFRNTYDSFKDLHNANMLYKYSYEAFIEGLKLKNAIESESIEFGLTSSGKAICRINDYLHFLQGNGIISEVFTEYKSTVKNLMSLLIYKYSNQSKKVIHEQPFAIDNGDEIFFDEIDFYCFVDCFNDKEIKALFNKYHVETIEFHNFDCIETAANNLMEYYEYANKTSKSILETHELQVEIKNCFTLLRYVNISQDLVNRICGFMLTHEFTEILIDDKVLFLDYQLNRRNMNSNITKGIVEDTLISYIDKHISTLNEGKEFNLLSRNSSINYFNLVHFLPSPAEGYISRRLSIRVSRILKNKLTQMYPHIIQHYSDYVSDYQRKRLITWANKQLEDDFSFDLFTLLIKFNARIGSKVKAQLKTYLRKEIEKAKESKSNKGVYVYPATNPYNELVQVGYWCLRRILRAKDYKEFLGNSDEFDFYYEYSSFDFNKFDVSWLLNLYPQTFNEISKNKTVKNKIRIAIVNELKNEELAEKDKKNLQDILINYFC